MTSEGELERAVLGRCPLCLTIGPVERLPEHLRNDHPQAHASGWTVSIAPRLRGPVAALCARYRLSIAALVNAALEHHLRRLVEL